MSFLKKLPKYYAAINKEYAQCQAAIEEIERRLDQGNEWHDCDCEYCEFENLPKLSTRDEIELVAKQDKLLAMQKETKRIILGMRNYAKIFNIKLEGE